MANFKLPLNWYTPRTEETYQAVNAWLNNKWNLPNGYEKPGGFITNHTQRGTQTPYKNAPKGYTLISHEQFMEYIVGKPLVKLVAPALPIYWIVKADKSPEFEEVLKFINATAGTNYKGKDQSYYGFDGAFKSRFEAEEFLNKPTVLTAEEFVVLLNNIPAKKQAGYKPAPQLAEIENLLEQEAINEGIQEELLPVRKGAAMNLNAPIPAPPVQGFANRAQYTVGHILVKTYPGSPVLGTNTRLNLAVNVKADAYQHEEFYQPIKEIVPVIGEFVKFVTSYAQIPKDHVTRIQRIDLVEGIPTIYVDFRAQNFRIPARYTQITEEVPVVIIGNFRCFATPAGLIEITRGQENGKTELTKADLRIIRQLNSRVFKVQIGEIAAVLTNAEIDRMLAL